MKMLFQSDDFGLTEAVTLGIVKAIEYGVIRNTGLFVNVPSSKFAAQFIPKFPEVCFGLDLNIVAGKPISNPKDVPSLVNEDGSFISSIEQFNNNEVVSNTNGIIIEFKNEPYDYEDVLTEYEAQYQEFINLTGQKPEYLHPHSLVTPTTLKAFRALSDKYKIPFSLDAYEQYNVYSLPADWNVKPVFKVEDQLKTNVAEKVLEILPQALDKEFSVLICHAGYVDADLLALSSYSLIRTRDLEMATSEKIKDFVDKNNIELITYRELSVQ